MTETIANTEAYDPYPRDWGHVPLEALVIEGGLVRGPFGGSLTKASFTKQGYKVYEQRNAIYRSTELGRYYIGSAKFKELERFQVSPGEMIVSCSGTIGQIFKLPENSPKGVINQALLKIRLDPERIHDDYFLHVFRSDEFQQRIKENTHGGAMQNLVGMPIFRQTTIACPPTIQEQRAIAEALGDVDELIGSLERLIVKKRDIKQAVMQQLLTGITRLPGFTGEWKSLRLGETATLKARIGWQGLTAAEYRTSGEFRLVTGTELINGAVEWERCFYVTKERFDQDRNIQLKTGDVLVTKDGTIGKVALVRDLPVPATLNSGVFVIRPISGAFDPGFFYRVLSSSVFVEFLNQLAAGSTINHLYQKDFVHFTFRVPPTVDEQQSIASMLDSMDDELSLLRQRLDKTRDIKQGMMQQLLTGKVRLV